MIDGWSTQIEPFWQHLQAQDSPLSPLNSLNEILAHRGLNQLFFKLIRLNLTG